MARSPFKVGQVVHLPLRDLPKLYPLAENAANYRRRPPDEASLDEHAESIKTVGQLQAVGLAWDGQGLVIAWGFRRIAAMQKHAKAFGFRSIECKIVPLELVDLARVAENLTREDPTSFETCKYLYELHHGKRGQRRSIAELSEAVGKSVSQVRNLIRFYRVLPEPAREAWRDDRDSRFTFRTLAALAVASQTSDEAVARELARLLGVALDGGEAPPAAPAEAPPAAPDGAGERPARFGRRVAKRLAKRLEKVMPVDDGGAPLDDRVRCVLVVLQGAAGLVPAADVEAVVNQVCTWFGPPSKGEVPRAS